MQKVLTAAQMREVDRLTTERYDIPSVILMENAAHAVARVITEKLGGSVKDKSILILCGKGNNGGDGAALARILASNGACVSLDLFASISESLGDARSNFEKLTASKRNGRFTLDFREISPAEMDGYFYENFPTLSDCLDESDVIVDALFGTGIIRPLEGAFAELVETLKNQKTTRAGKLFVSVDVPSGLSADSDKLIGENCDAHVTVTFTAPKPANVLSPASHFNGELVVADIGSPQELIDEQPSQLYLAERHDAGKWLTKSAFTADSYKNKRGHALIIAGSDNYSGAVVLAANAAMRSGVGLVTVAAPKECKAEIASRLLPDVILTAIDTDVGSPEVLVKADAIAVGCGLSATDPAIERLVRRIVNAREAPVVIDAGALWFYSPFEANKPNDSEHPLILTPHEGEFLRLIGTDDKDAIRDRVATVREFATKHNVILVLKGERVLIGAPDGRVVINPTGNSGLGKAGNGDTLTGILAGFVAQAAKMNIDMLETVVAAVYVAGMAGDVAEKKYGKRVMTASDVRECLVEVFTQFENIRTG